MKILLWILFLSLGLFLCRQDRVLQTSGYSLTDLKLAGSEQGSEILRLWEEQHYGDLRLTAIARSNTRWDFAFIIVYVSLLITLSNWQMQRERWMPLNELLRFNFLLAVTAGVLDGIENFRLLHNFHQAGYWSTHCLAVSKLVLLGIAVLIFLTSWVKSLVVKQH